MSLVAKTVRIACDLTSVTPALDVLTGLRPVFWRGGVAKVQCALFNGDPSAGTYVADTSNIRSVQLIVRKYNVRGPVLLDKVLVDSDVVDSSYSVWIAGTGQQFEFELSEAYTSFAPLDSGSLPVYFTIQVITTSSSYVAAFGYAQIVDVGITDIVAPALPVGFYDLPLLAETSQDITVILGRASIRYIGNVLTPTPYTYSIVLLTTDVIENAQIDLLIQLPAMTGATVEVRNGTLTGSQVHYVVSYSDNPTFEFVTFRFDGNVWVKFGPEVT